MRGDLNNIVQAKIIDNTTEQISPGDLRDVLAEFTSEQMNIDDDFHLYGLRAMTARAYKVGELFTFDGVIYEVVTAHTAGTTPDTTKVVKVIETVAGGIVDWVAGAVEQGKVYNYNGVIIRRDGADITSTNPSSEIGWKFLQNEMVTASVVSSILTFDCKKSNDTSFFASFNTNNNTLVVNNCPEGGKVAVTINNASTTDKSLKLDPTYFWGDSNNRVVITEIVLIPGINTFLFVRNKTQVFNSFAVFGTKIIVQNTANNEAYNLTTWQGDIEEAPTRSALSLKFEDDKTYYLNEIAQVREGLAPKTPVDVTIETDIDLGSTHTILQGVSINLGSRVALIGQNLSSENGIYVADILGNLTRSDDMNAAAEFLRAYFYTEAGTNVGKRYVVTQAPAIVDTDDVIIIYQNANVIPNATETVIGAVELSDSSEVDATITLSTEPTTATNKVLNLKQLWRFLEYLKTLFLTQTSAISTLEFKNRTFSRSTNLALATPNIQTQVFRNVGSTDISVFTNYTGCKINGQINKSVTVKPGQFATVKAIDASDPNNYFVFVTDEVPAVGGGGGGGGGGTWGSITGTLSSQTDLQSALDTKLNKSGSNADQDIDLGTFSLNAKHVKINGTGGAGHVGLKHQSADLTASGSETSIGANNTGRVVAKNASASTEVLAYKSEVDTAETNAKAYADGLVVGLLDDRGNYNPSTNSNQYPTAGGSGTAGAIKKGDLWTINGLGSGVSVAIGGAFVSDGDVVRALVDTPAQTNANWVITENNIGYVPENANNKTSTILGNETSTSFYATIKGIVDYFTGTRIRTLLGITTLSGSNTGDETNATIKTKLGADLTNKIDKQQEVGNLFTETWSNLTNWTNIGTPVATVVSGYVNFAGTIGFANGIRQSNFGNINSELFEIKFKYKIGTINGSTYGQILGLDSQSTLGSSYQNHIGVQITSYTGNIGFIQWYHNKNSTPVQVSKYGISLTTGDILDCKLTSNIDGYVFEAVKADGTKVVDRIYYNSGVGYTRVLNNASQLAIYAFGGNHQIGELSVKCQQSVNADYLIIGNSIMSQYSSGNVEDRIVNKLNQRFDANFENLSRPSNSVLDHNTKEIVLFNPKNIIIDSISNTLASNANVTTTMSNLATTVTSFGSMITANAPTGYSIANGNLKICTPLPRGNANFQTIQAQLLSTYGKDNVIDLHAVTYNGTINLSPDDSFDTVHPNQYLADRLCDKIGYDLGLKRKTKDRNPLLPFQFNNQNGFLGIGKRSLAKFLFDIVAADGSAFPQTPFRISSPSNVGGGTITSNLDSQIYIMGGAYWNGTAFIALATTASAVVMQDGEVTYQVATGLTVNSTFSFVNAFKTDSAGRLLTGNWVGYATGWTPPTNSGQAVFSDKKRYIRTGGTNPACGVVKLVNGTITVANTAITTNSSIILSYVQILGSSGSLETSISAGSSFTILSRMSGTTTTNTADISFVYYEIVERFA